MGAKGGVEAGGGLGSTRRQVPTLTLQVRDEARGWGNGPGFVVPTAAWTPRSTTRLDTTEAWRVLRCGRGRREVDPQRLVWVRTGGPGGSGSGYLIGPQLVLTALHVVLVEGRWAGRVEARVGHPRYGAGPVGRRARVCWPDPQQGAPPADALDVALLWLEEPVPTGDEPVHWGRPTGVVPVPFEGAGFPAFAAEAGTPGEFEYVRGELPDVSTSPSGWVLDCPVWPAPGRGGERPWAGASGSAIFCHGRLVGVAVEDNRAMDYRRLHAVPIHEALSLPGFATLVSRHGYVGTTAVLEEVTAHNTAAGSGRGMWSGRWRSGRFPPSVGVPAAQHPA